MNDILEVIDELKKILEFDDDQIREEVEIYVCELQAKADRFERDMEDQYNLFEQEFMENVPV